MGDCAGTISPSRCGRIDFATDLDTSGLSAKAAWIRRASIRVSPANERLIDFQVLLLGNSDDFHDIDERQQILIECWQRFTWRKNTSIFAGSSWCVVSLWLWIYWGLPRVPDAETIWALNRQESGHVRRSRRRHLGRPWPVLRQPRPPCRYPRLRPARRSSRSRIAASMSTRAWTASACCAPCSPIFAPAKPCRAALR